MTLARFHAVLLVLCAFLGSQVVHALHPLAHRVADAAADGCCASQVESIPTAGPAVDAPSDDESSLECALCTSSAPLGPVALWVPAQAPELAQPRLASAPTAAPARAPPGVTRTRAPPFVL